MKGQTSTETYRENQATRLLGAIPRIPATATTAIRVFAKPMQLVEM